MIPDGLQYSFKHFGNFQKCDQISTPGPLTYYRRNSKHKNIVEIIYEHRSFVNLGMQNLDNLANTNVPTFCNTNSWKALEDEKESITIKDNEFKVNHGKLKQKQRNEHLKLSTFKSRRRGQAEKKMWEEDTGFSRVCLVGLINRYRLTCMCIYV